MELAKLRDEFDVVGDVRGKGLMIGVELVADKVASIQRNTISRFYKILRCICRQHERLFRSNASTRSGKAARTWACCSEREGYTARRFASNHPCASPRLTSTFPLTSCARSLLGRKRTVNTISLNQDHSNLSNRSETYAFV